MKLKVLIALTSALGLVLSPMVAHAAPAKPSKPVLTSASEPGATSDEAQILVTWAASASPDLVGHAVRLTGGSTVLDGQETCQAGSCSATFSNLIGGTSYTAIVTAINASGQTTASDTSLPFFARSVPSVAQERNVQAENSSLVLSWSAPANSGGTAITEYRITAPGSDFAGADVAGDELTYTANTLTRGTSYTFQIIAVNQTGSSISGAFSATLAPNVPAAPSAPSLSASGQSVNAEWSAPNDRGSQITGYVVTLYRSGQVVATDSAVDGSQTSVSFVTTTAGDYRVTVAARNDVGLGATSALSAVVNVGGTALLANIPVFSPSSVAAKGVSQTQSVSATSASGIPVSLRSASAAVCSLSLGVITTLAQGECAIVASAQATETHDVGEQTLRFFVKLSQSISMNTIISQSYPGSLSLAGLALPSSGLAASFTVSGNCSLVGSTVTFDSVGSCTVTAAQAGNNGFFAAPSLPRTFSILASGGAGAGSGSGSNPLQAPVLTGRPSLSGKAALGEFLIATPGTWQLQTDLDFTYRWFRCENALTAPTAALVAASCAVIEGARLVRYGLIAADEGKHLLVEVTAVNSAKLQTVTQSATVQFGTEGAPAQSNAPAYWPKRLSATSVKLYAKNVVGVGKVSFRLNGKEIAWVRAVDATDPKLRLAGTANYLVRTVNLGAGKNVLEILADGKRVRRAIYTR